MSVQPAAVDAVVSGDESGGDEAAGRPADARDVAVAEREEPRPPPALVNRVRLNRLGEIMGLYTMDFRKRFGVYAELPPGMPEVNRAYYRDLRVSDTKAYGWDLHAFRGRPTGANNRRPNERGAQLGDEVVIVNYYRSSWYQRPVRDRRMEGRRGMVVGYTPQFVHFALYNGFKFGIGYEQMSTDRQNVRVVTEASPVLRAMLEVILNNDHLAWWEGDN